MTATLTGERSAATPGSGAALIPAFEALFIERGEEGTAAAAAARRALPHLEPQIFDAPAAAEPPEGGDRFAAGKRRLVLVRRRGNFLDHCPAGTPGLICCNYLILTLGSNCPMDCGYCFLQSYLRNNPALKVYTNPHDGLAEVDRVLRRHPDRKFRIGTGEFVDSLALDPMFETSALLVPFFASRRNAVLELKTKTAAVDGLLRLDGRGRVVVSWSMAPEEIVADEERGAASLAGRIDAARRAQRAGYKVGFHFDPLIEYPDWEEGYRSVVERLAAAIDPRGVAWVSCGSLRLTPRLRSTIRERGLRRFMGGELVPSPDGKLRLWPGLRVKMYRRLVGWLREWSAEVPVYACMESAAVWRRVFGEAPGDQELAKRLLAGAGR